jgi:phosphopantothenoylcysteine decarboxylase / phosphopantothenate---cysteine ligase
LLATYLSARCPVVLAPAMDLDMYQHPATQANLQRLVGYGHHLVAPNTGELASGLHGPGRLAEPEEIIQFLDDLFAQQAKPLPLAGHLALVTAGPTVEAIDPVRFISNRSSGKMGYAIAEELAQRGAAVMLVSGPTHLQVTHPRIARVAVESADQMYQAVMENLSSASFIVQSAAVADYTPEEVALTKIKKKDTALTLSLVKTKDIAGETAKLLRPDQLHIGFALETDRELENAQDKLARKRFDFIVLNSLRDAGAGFGHDTNKVTIVRRQGPALDLPLMSKREVAQKIVDLMVEMSGRATETEYVG